MNAQLTLPLALEPEQLIELAREHAAANRHPVICTEHLLFQFVQDGSPFRPLFDDLELHISEIQQRLMTALSPAQCSTDVIADSLTYSQGVNSCLIKAEILARMGKSPMITCNHLFLALLAHKTSVTISILQEYIKLGQLKQAFEIFRKQQATAPEAEAVAA